VVNGKRSMLGRLGFTAEYVGGLLAGAGAGMLLMGYILFHRDLILEMGELFILAFSLIAIGRLIASRAQQRKWKDGGTSTSNGDNADHAQPKRGADSQ
jgi:predicted lipid-binding transport protein (Tim44 family)